MNECHVPVFRMSLSIKGVHWQVAPLCHFPFRDRHPDWRPSIIGGEFVGFLGS